MRTQVSCLPARGLLSLLSPECCFSSPSEAPPLRGHSPSGSYRLWAPALFSLHTPGLCREPVLLRGAGLAEGGEGRGR